MSDQRSTRPALTVASVAATVVRTYMSMVLTQERFHADPHPGNLFAMSGDRLGIVDFGEVGSISPATRTTISAMLIGIASRDAISLADSSSATKTPLSISHRDVGAPQSPPGNLAARPGRLPTWSAAPSRRLGS